MKARFNTEQEAVAVLPLSGNMVQVTLCLNGKYIHEEYAEGETWEGWEYDYNELTADKAQLPMEDIYAHPEKYLDYNPERMAELYHQGDAALQQLIDTTAAEKGYTNGYTLLSYLQSPDPTQAAQAATFNQWRYEAQSAAKSIFAAVASGERTAPTVEEFVAELPKIVWPE